MTTSPLQKIRSVPSRSRPRSMFAIGVGFVLVVAIVTTLLYFKSSITTVLRSGDTVKVEFTSNPKLTPNESKVTFAGLESGVVSGINYVPHGVVVSLKVDDSVRDMLGSAPSVVVVPTTVLGGSYSVELKPGGTPGPYNGGVIPPTSAALPVELDKILEALPRPTRDSLRHVVGQSDATLADGGKDALRDLVANAPGTMRPGGDVLRAVQGTRPDVDLPQLVTNLNAAAGAMDRREGQLSDIVTSLRKTTDSLATQSRPLAAGIETLPATLRATRTGMSSLRGTLSKLRSTADSFRPAAQEIDPLLQRLDPVLVKARPLLDDLRPLLDEAYPTVQQLVPTVQRGTQTLEPLKGPVLDRVNGPIARTVMNTWRGSGPYKDSGGGMQADHTFYQELGYMVSNLDRASMTQDAQGTGLGFQVGVNTGSVATPLTLPTLPDLLNNLQKAASGGGQ